MRLKGKKLYITGGNGMIGRALIDRFHAAGCQVTTLSRNASTSGLPEGVEAQQANITDPASLDFTDADLLIHGAAFVGFGLTPEKNRIMWETNVTGTEHVLDAAARDGVKRVLHISSVAAVGRTGPAIRDESWVWERPEVFHSEYERSKYHAHRLAHARDDLDVVSVMPSIVLGMGETSSGLLLKRFLQRKIPVAVKHPGDLAFVHVDDVAAGAEAAMRKGNGSYILSEAGMTMPQLFRRFERLTGVRRPRISVPLWAVQGGVSVSEPVLNLFGRAARVNKDFVAAMREGTHLDNSRARKELTWEPDMDVHITADAAAWRGQA